VPKADKDKAREFTEVQAIVSESRFVIKSLQVSGVTLYHQGDKLIIDNADTIRRLAGLAAVSEVESGTGLYLTTTDRRCWLDISSSAAREYLTKLSDKRAATEALIAQLEGRLANKGYVDNAPKKIVDETKQQLEETRAQLTKISGEYDRFNIQ
jgi:valyl-tRNA synthetase